jgi:Transglycosylase SLT domain
MRHIAIRLTIAVFAVLGPTPFSQIITARVDAQTSPAATDTSPSEQSAQDFTRARLQADFAAMRTFRPSYPFWRNIFTIPDGRIIFGSAEDGRLLATFPVRGDWARLGVWEDPTLASVLDDHRLPSRLNLRREEVVRLLEATAGPLVHNPTRGLFLLPNAERYGSFLGHWAAIYERFAVPAEIGLAQAIIESGLNPKARSRARAVGFCQWLPGNWDHLNRLAPYVIEAYNQTTQAPYCAAYLTILATMYGSFSPALSEHHAGGVNVGRTVINGERLGGADTREQYLLGAQFARDLRGIALRRYRELFRTFGLRSFLYPEMVFGNALTVTRLLAETPQSQIFAMRAERAIPLAEVTRRTGLSVDEVKRFNPALVSKVPPHASLYLPQYIPEFGPDVSFWHHPASPAFATVLNEFVRLEAKVQEWHEPSFEPTLRGFQERFEGTGTEEGTVMATTLAYVIDDLRTSRRAAILDEFRTSKRILRLFRQGVSQLSAAVPGS